MEKKARTFTDDEVEALPNSPEEITAAEKAASPSIAAQVAQKVGGNAKESPNSMLYDFFHPAEMRKATGEPEPAATNNWAEGAALMMAPGAASLMARGLSAAKGALGGSAAEGGAETGGLGAVLRRAAKLGATALGLHEAEKFLGHH